MQYGKNGSAEKLRQMTEKQLKGCLIDAEDSAGRPIRIYTPDGRANYNALWTRDFAYMAEYAGDLMETASIYDNFNYLWEGIRPSDGWVPDRVDSSRIPVYAAGSPEFPCGRPNLDNGPFLAFIACLLAERLKPGERAALWKKYAPGVYGGLACLPRDERQLVYNEPSDPHSPYGFTDCIRKTGSLFMESLLLWRASAKLADALEKEALFPEETAACRAVQRGIEEAAVPTFYDIPSGLFLAATKDCRQPDLWASVYAAAIDFPLSEKIRKGIADWFCAHRDGVLQHGHLRHTEAGRSWQALLLDVPEGEYQNGAFWSVPTGWLIRTVERYDPAFAEQCFEEAVAYFEADNIYECINGSYRKLPDYVTSATNLYALTV